MFHKDLHGVTVSDEAGDTPKEFHGIVFGNPPEAGSDQTTTVLVVVDDASNGFGWPVGTTVAPLKHLGDGKYGA